MGSDKLYRWEKRRKKKSQAKKGFRLDILDWVMLTLIITLFFIFLRLFFIFEVVSAPCAEIFLTAGQGPGYPPIFQLTFLISLLVGLFWLCVTLHRMIFRPAHWGLISWHFTLALSVMMLALVNSNLTSSTYVNSPDGVMIVENMTPTTTQDGVTWASPSYINWLDYRNGQWHAWGSQACIWLDDNKVSYNDNFGQSTHKTSAPKLFFQGRLFEALKEDQLYRPLTEYERSLFLEIKACQANITHYGKPASTCQSRYDYPVPLGIEPSEIFLGNWFSGYIQKSPLH